MMQIIEWLLSSSEPWTRYRTRVDLLGEPENDPLVMADRQAMFSHPGVQALTKSALSWGDLALKRHNDASHPLYAISTLADFGLRSTDDRLQAIAASLMGHQTVDGSFQTPLLVAAAYGGSNQALWAWMACDAPTLLYALAAFCLAGDERVLHAADHLVSLVNENGYRCSSAPELGGFRGPGRRSDPCPIANLYALKALSVIPVYRESEAASKAAEMLLSHWADQKSKKYYLFGVGTDFRKLKYPFVWYDVLHVVEVLSRFEFVHSDPRFVEMLQVITDQADEQGCYTASSMYQAWKGWSFADKKAPSPWLTFLVQRILKRVTR